MAKDLQESLQEPIESLRAARRRLKQDCTRCPLYRDATQAVPGEGPSHAALMLVGEQPGDKEDLAGKPFVGPTGRASRPGAARRRHRPARNLRHRRGQAFQARDARQAPAAQAPQHLRNRTLQDLARYRAQPGQALDHRRARRHCRAQPHRAHTLTIGKVRGKPIAHGGRHATDRHHSSVGAAAHRGR